MSPASWHLALLGLLASPAACGVGVQPDPAARAGTLPSVETSRWLNGTLWRFAGTTQPGYSGDGGPAGAAQLNGPAGLAIDGSGNVYIADLRNHVIRRVDAASRVITTVAGRGTAGFSGDGGPARRSELNSPEGVALDANGNLYIADSGNQRIRRVDAMTGKITTIAGTGVKGRDLAPMVARESRLNHPSGVVVDSAGRVYFNDYANDAIRRIDLDGMLRVVTGTGEPGYTGDGGPATAARINDVYGLALDRTGALYFVDSLNFGIRRVDPSTGIIVTVVGRGEPGPVIEFVATAEARLGGAAHRKGTIGHAVAHGVEVDAHGNVFVADTGVHRVRMLHRASNQFFTVAGCGRSGVGAEGELAIRAELDTHGVRIAPNGNLYSVDFTHHVVQVIRFPPPDGRLSARPPCESGNASCGGRDAAGMRGAPVRARVFDAI